ncbi:VOC family protein [Leucobacter musarum]|uniref:VOC family protein n=1 Tax=Leucobacter musarum TaxID=1930747 RepID=UPI0006A75DEE|nr:VOC family protein [Leucobacter musarum]
MATSAARSRKPLLITLIVAVVLIVAGAITWIAIAQSASAESDAQPTAALPEETHMGVVEIAVHDLEKVQQYYVDAVGLRVIDDADHADAVATGSSVLLGLDEPILRLTPEDSGEAGSTLTDPGLYHTAILYPDAPALAATILQVATNAPDTFQGSADHAVSQAFYFLDPEGNGLELYVDRPRDEWKWKDGEVQMGSEALDPNQFITEHLGTDVSAIEEATPDAATVGHVHLKVGDLQQAEDFYAGALGFAVTARDDGALFYSAGGYHHHLATNVWQSEGAEARTNATGLAGFTVSLPDAAAIDAAEDRLASAGYSSQRSGDVLTAWDPWGNAVHLVVGSAP